MSKKRKTAKRLKEELAEVKGRAEFEACRFAKEVEKRKKLQEELKKRGEELEKKNAHTQELEQSIKETKRLLTNRDKRIVELSSYAELEALKQRFDQIGRWSDTVVVGTTEYHFYVEEKGIKIWSKDHSLDKQWMRQHETLIPPAEDFLEDAKKLVKVAQEAYKIEVEFHEIKKGLERLAGVLEPLHEIISKPPEQPVEKDGRATASEKV